MSLLEPPTPSPVPEVPINDLLPPSVRERVKIGPVPDWVAVRELDESYRIETGSATTEILHDHQYHVAAKSGYHRKARRLETLNAVHQGAQWRLDFDPATQVVTIHSIEVRRSGKRVDYAQPHRVRLLQREAGLASLVITGHLTIMVVMDDVRVGDILDVSYTVESVSSTFPHHFSTMIGYPTSVPLREFQLSVRFSSNSEPQWKGSVDFPPPAVRELGEEKEWSWRFEKLKPRLYERRIPSSEMPAPWLQLTNFASWSEVAEGIATKWGDRFDDPRLMEQVRNIAEASASMEERVERAIAFVQDEIRYLSSNVEFGATIPAPPGEVVERRYGDCKDKSFLLVHLLRSLGIPARAVLVNSQLQRGVERLLPMPGAFDHVIAEYEIEGQRRWVDGTVVLQGRRVLDRWVPDFGAGLPISAGITRLQKIPLSLSRDFFHLRETFRLDTTGRPTLLRIHITAGGRDAEAERKSIQIEGVEAVSKQREQHYRQFFPEVKRLDTLEWRDDPVANTIVLAETLELPNALQPIEGEKAFVFRYRSWLVQNLLAYPDSEKRRNPLELPPRCDIEHWIEIEASSLPRGETVTTHKKDNVFRFSAEVKKLFGRWTAHFRLRTLANEVPFQHFDNFKKRVDEVMHGTVIGITVPQGIAAPRGRRKGRFSVESSGAFPEKPKLSSENAAQREPLADTPAPAIVGDETSSRSTRSSMRITPRLPVEEKQNDPGSFEASAETPSISSESMAPAATPEATIESGGEERPLRSRRRRRRKVNFKKWAVLIGLLLVFAVTLALWIAVVKRGH